MKPQHHYMLSGLIVGAAVGYAAGYESALDELKSWVDPKIEDCESSLPREQKCILTVVPSANN